MIEGMIDSHCHLDTRVYGDDAGVDAVVARAVAAGVSKMVAIGSGYGFASGERAVAAAKRHPMLRASVGLHPHDAQEFNDERFAAMLALAAAPEVVAIGEMGLDYHYNYSPREAQLHAFRAQVRAAKELEKPIIIHDRESGGEALTVLDEEDAWATGVVYHCYTGDADMMRAITDRGGYISIPGIVTFKSADVMRAVAAATPEARLLIETDSPFLTPAPYRGKKNEPGYLPYVAAKVAELRGMSPATLQALTSENTSRFFRL